MAPGSPGGRGCSEASRSRAAAVAGTVLGNIYFQRPRREFCVCFCLFCERSSLVAPEAAALVGEGSAGLCVGSAPFPRPRPFPGSILCLSPTSWRWPPRGSTQALHLPAPAQELETRLEVCSEVPQEAHVGGHSNRFPDASPCWGHWASSTFPAPGTLGGSPAAELCRGVTLS